MSEDFRQKIIEATLSFDTGALDAAWGAGTYDAGIGYGSVEARSGDEKISDAEISFLLPGREVVKEFVKFAGTLGIPFEAMRFVEGYEGGGDDIEVRLPASVALDYGAQLKKLERIFRPMAHDAVHESFEDFIDGLALELQEANPFHGKDGKFTSAKKLASQGGSISLKKLSRNKFGVKSGKFDRRRRRWAWKYSKTWKTGWRGDICGRSARMGGRNVRCYDGKEGWNLRRESAEISTDELVERLRGRAERILGVPRGFFGRSIAEDEGMVRLRDLL